MNIDTVEELTSLPAASNEPAPLDLVEHVNAMLQKAGVQHHMAWMASLNPVAINNPDINQQRFLINRAWVAIFSTLKTEDELLRSRNARGCLMNGKCSVEDWNRLFETQVIPCAIELNVLQKTT